MASDLTVGMDLGGFGSGCGYGSLWLVMVRWLWNIFYLFFWVCGVVMLWCGDFFDYFIDYCKIMIILISSSVTSDFLLVWWRNCASRT